MTTLDTGLATLRSAAGHVSASYDWFTRWLKGLMPTGLYGRALLIIITRWWLQSWGRRVHGAHCNRHAPDLGGGDAEISALIASIAPTRRMPTPALRRIALERWGCRSISFLLEMRARRSRFLPDDQALSQQISSRSAARYGRHRGRSNRVEIRIRLDDTLSVLRHAAPPSVRIRKSSVGMIGTPIVLGFAILSCATR